MQRKRNLKKEEINKLWGFMLDEDIETGELLREKTWAEDKENRDDKIGRLLYFKYLDLYRIEYGWCDEDGNSDTNNYEWFYNQRDAIDYFNKLGNKGGLLKGMI